MTTKKFSSHVFTALDEKGLKKKVEKHKVVQIEAAKRQGTEDGYNNVPSNIGEAHAAPFEKKIVHQNNALIADVSSTIEQWESDTAAHDMIIQSALKKGAMDMNTVDEKLFNTEYESHIRSVEIQKTKKKEVILTLEEDQRGHEIEMQSIIASLGYRPIKKPSYKKTLNFLLLTVLCIAEMPLNYTSLVNITDDLAIFWCWGLAAFISLVIGVASHQAGKFLKNEQYVEAGISLSAIVLILVVIMFLRVEDGGHMILVLINLSISIVAIVSSFIAEEKKQEELDRYFLHDNALKKKGKKLIKLREAYIKFEIQAEEELMEQVRIHAKSLMESKAYKQAYEERRTLVVRMITIYKEQTIKQIKAYSNEVIYVYRTANQNARSAQNKERVHFWDNPLISINR